MEEERIIKMLEEQTKILKSLRRAQRMSSVFNILKLLVILAPFVWAYFYLPPLLDQYRQAYEQSILGAGQITLPEGFSLQDVTQLLERN